DQRPAGFSAQNMQDLRSYYGMELGWKAAPAAFVDDHGIWVFNGFLTPGRHSPSWNFVTWGIEQLGDFETDDYDAGRGAKVRDNTIAAMAILSIAAGFEPDTIRFHKEDTLTSHKNCPGHKCGKAAVQQALRKAMKDWRKRWNEVSAR